jgi:hypothetical protein
MRRRYVEGLKSTCEIGDSRLQAKAFVLPDGRHFTVRLSRSQWDDYLIECKHLEVCDEEFVEWVYLLTLKHEFHEIPEFYLRLQRQFFFAINLMRFLRLEECGRFANDNEKEILMNRCKESFGVGIVDVFNLNAFSGID